MSRVRSTKSVLLALAIASAATGAMAQSVNIPLQLEEGSSGVVLIINVGIDGQAPRPYLFDTGSNMFNAFYSASAFGAVPESMASPTLAYPKGLGANVTYNYGDTGVGNVYTINVVATPSVTFYPTSAGASSGVTLNATTPSGAASSFLMGAVTQLNGSSNVSQPVKGYGSFGGYYGIFGADTVVNAYPGGVLGQAVVPGASAGYVVAANGQALSASIPGATTNGPQVGQSVTSCSPCVMLGLTPALLAQFTSADSLTAKTTRTSFPNSGAPSLGQFGVDMNVALSGPGEHSASYDLPTLLDTGTPTNIVKLSGATAATLHWPTGSTMTISDTKPGSDTTAYSVVAPGTTAPPSPYVATTATVVPTATAPVTPSIYLGVGFFLENSVLFNLAGDVIGYTPNFVTDANISTTVASPLVIGSNSVPLGLAGIISGPGGLSVTSGGSATLSGTNTYTGATTVNGGKLALVGPGSIAASSGVNVSAGGVFNIAGTTSGAAIASLSGDAQGAVKLGAETLTLFDASGAYAGAITGAGGLTLTGGSETLTGTTTYTGSTTASGGALDVEGAISGSSSVTVNAGGALEGAGLIHTPTTTIASGGALAPGTPSASMTIEGDLALQPGAEYLIATTGTLGSSARVSGVATLGGATVAWAPQASTFGKFSGATYPILAAASLSGAFSPSVAAIAPSAEKIVTDGAASLSYAGGDVTLSIPAYAVTLQLPTSASANAQNAAGAVNTAILGGAAIPSGFQNLTSASGGALNTAANQLAGQPGGAFAPIGFLAGDMVLNMALNPFIDGRDGGFGPGAPSAAPFAAAYAEDPLAARAEAAIPKPTPPPQFIAWGGSYGGVGSIGGNAASGAAAAASQIYGFAAGLDDHVAANTLVGLALGGGLTNWQLSQGMGSGQSGMAQASVYGSSHSGPAYVSGALAYAWHDVTTNRVVSLAGSDKLDANFDANVVSSRLEAGYRLPANLAFAALPANLGVTPYAAAEAQGLFLPGYSETAAPGSSAQFALSYGSRDFSTVRTELGAWFDVDLPAASGALKFYSRAAWAHDFDNESTVSAVFQQVSAASFLVNTAKPAPNSGLVTAGLEYRLADGWSVLAKFDGDVSSTTSSYAGSAVLRKTW